MKIAITRLKAPLNNDKILCFYYLGNVNKIQINTYIHLGAEIVSIIGGGDRDKCFGYNMIELNKISF